MKLFNFKPRIRVHYTVCPNSVISEFSSNDCDLFKIAGDDKTLEQKLTCDNVEKSATNMVAFSRSDESLHAFNNEKATVFQKNVADQMLNSLPAIRKVYFNKSFLRIEKFIDSEVAWRELFPVIERILTKNLPTDNKVSFKMA